MNNKYHDSCHDHAYPDKPEHIHQHRIPILNRFPWQEQVGSRKLQLPPMSPRKGERYLIPNNIETTLSPWLKYSNYIAWYDGYNWHYDMPSAGWKTYVIDENDTLIFNGLGWVSDSAVNVNGVNLKEIYVNSNVGPGGAGNSTSPFPNINTALNKIIFCKDSTPYKINISPGKYNEIIALENNYLYNLVLEGSDKNQVFVNTNQKSIQSTINNNNLFNLVFKNITFEGTVILEGHLNKTSFSNITFDNCRFEHNIYLKNICMVKFSNCTEIRKNHITIENVGYCLFDETIIIDPELNNIKSENNFHIHDNYYSNFHDDLYNGNVEKINNNHSHCCCIPDIPISPPIDNNNCSFTIITDPVGNSPDFWTNKTQVILKCDLKRSIDWKTLNNSEILFKCENNKIGVLGYEYFIPKNVHYISTNSFMYGNYHINGDLILENSNIFGHTWEHNTGKLTILGQPARQTYNDSAVPGKNVKDALDYLFKNGGSGGEGTLNFELKYDNEYNDILLTFK